jgi:RNA-directed DNA polymerase
MTNALREIQRHLYQEARRQPSRPFDQVLRFVTDWIVINEAWRLVRSSHGANTPGADRLIARDLPLDSADARAFLQDLAGRLQSGSYRPGAVRRFEIAKPNQPGKTRPIAILNLEDRVVHMALKIVLEPMIEALLGPRSFGFRPNRNRFDQLQAVRRLVIGNPDQYGAALSADISSCFDELDHGLILDDLRALVADAGLIKLFILLLEQVGSGREGWLRKRRVGVLQGSPLSPLLANWNLARFDRAWRQKYGDRAPLFRYADDLLILARNQAEAARLGRPLEHCLSHANRLALANGKTRIATIDQGVQVLGLLLRCHQDPFVSRREVRIFIDTDQFKTVFAEIDGWVDGLDPGRSLGAQFAQFNQRIRGWFESYQYAYDAPQAFESFDQYLFVAMRRRLKALRGCSVAVLQEEHHRRLSSGHDTWHADGVTLLVLGSLPRKCYRPKQTGLAWEIDVDQTEVARPTRPTSRASGQSAATPSGLRQADPVIVAMLRRAAAKSARGQDISVSAPDSMTVPVSNQPSLVGASLSENGQSQPTKPTLPEGPDHAS